MLPSSRVFDPNYRSVYRCTGADPLHTSKQHGFTAFSTFKVYETRLFLYIAAGDDNGENVVLLCVARTKPIEKLVMFYDNNGCIYENMMAAASRIDTLCSLNNNPVERAYPISAILGVIPLFDTYYFIMATRAEPVALIMGRTIYTVSESEIVPVPSAATYQPSSTESQYLQLLKDFDLSKDFYFSYHYDLSNTQQEQYLSQSAITNKLSLTTIHGASRSHPTPDGAVLDASPSSQDAGGHEPDINSLPGAPSVQLVSSPSSIAPKEFSNYYTWNLHIAKLFIQHFPFNLSMPEHIRMTLPSSTKQQHLAKPPPLSEKAKKSTDTPSQQPVALSRRPESASKSATPQEPIALMGPYSPYRFIPAVISGYVSQTRFMIDTETYVYTMIARRGIEFAGTRYHRRGVCMAGSRLGSVANDVESEMILYKMIKYEDPDHTAAASQHTIPADLTARPGAHPRPYCFLTSGVMYRGSIPTLWRQDVNWSLMPTIHIDPVNDSTLVATELHFRRLLAKYHGRVHCLSLIKTQEKTPREALLGEVFGSITRKVNRSLCGDDFEEARAFNQAPLLGVGHSRCPCYYANLSPLQQQGLAGVPLMAKCPSTRCEMHYKTQHWVGGGQSQSQPSGSNPQPTPRTKELPPMFVHSIPTMKSFYGSCVAYHTYDFLLRSKNNHNVVAELDTLGRSIVDECGVFSCVTGPNASHLFSSSSSIPAGSETEAQSAMHSTKDHKDVCNTQQIVDPLPSEMTPFNSHGKHSDGPTPTFDHLSEDVVISSYQNGVCRVNCIDCCDRTNVSMYILAKRMLARQFHAIHLLETYATSALVSPPSELAQVQSSKDDSQQQQVDPADGSTIADQESPSYCTTSPAIAAEITPNHSQGVSLPVSGPSTAPTPEAPPLDDKGYPPLHPTMIQLLQFVFTEHGDRISFQYTGTSAMHKELLFTHDYDTKNWSHLPYFLPRRKVRFQHPTKTSQINYRYISLAHHLTSLPQGAIPAVLEPVYQTLVDELQLHNKQGRSHEDNQHPEDITHSDQQLANISEALSPSSSHKPQLQQRETATYIWPSILTDGPMVEIGATSCYLLREHLSQSSFDYERYVYQQQQLQREKQREREREQRSLAPSLTTSPSSESHSHQSPHVSSDITSNPVQHRDGNNSGSHLKSSSLASSSSSSSSSSTPASQSTVAAPSLSIDVHESSRPLSLSPAASSLTEGDNALAPPPSHLSPTDLSLQLSSPAAKNNSKKEKMSGKASNMLTAAKRYYKNNVTDIKRQYSCTLFLGHFIPRLKKSFGDWIHFEDNRSNNTHLWDLAPEAVTNDNDLWWNMFDTRFVICFQTPAVFLSSHEAILLGGLWNQQVVTNNWRGVSALLDKSGHGQITANDGNRVGRHTHNNPDVPTTLPGTSQITGTVLPLYHLLWSWLHCRDSIASLFLSYSSQSASSRSGISQSPHNGIIHAIEPPKYSILPTPSSKLQLACDQAPAQQAPGDGSAAAGRKVGTAGTVYKFASSQSPSHRDSTNPVRTGPENAIPPPESLVIGEDFNWDEINHGTLPFGRNRA